MKVTLTNWAASHFDPPPADRTLRLWVREGRIIPAPLKIGRTYYVEPGARHWDEVRNAPLEPLPPTPPPTARPIDLDTVSAEDCRQWIISPECQRVLCHEQHQDCGAAGIYALFLEGRLVYIGMSVNVGLRLRSHYMSEKRYDATAFMPVPYYACRAMETAHIHALLPRLNERYDLSNWPGHFSLVKLIRAAWETK